MSVPIAGRRKGQATTPTTTTTTITTNTPVHGVPSWLDDTPSVAAPSSASPSAFPQPSTVLPSSSDTTSAGFLSPSAFSATSAFPAFEGTNVSVPAFLRHEETQRHTAPPASPASQLPTDVERSRRLALSEELDSVTQQLIDVTGRVEVLQGDGHPAAAEVRELDATLGSLREKEAEATRRKAERDAQVQLDAREGAPSAETHVDLNAATSAYRAECTQRHGQALDAVTSELQAQHSKNVALQKECEDAMSNTPESRCQAAAFQALQRRLQDGVRHLKQHFSQQCNSAVALSARTFLASARQQRSELFANDAARRAAKLQSYRAQRDTSAREFNAECHSIFQGRADSLFGALKTSLEKRHRRLADERNQRLGAFHAQLHATTERGRVALEQQLRALTEREVAITAAQRDSANSELLLRRDELARQRRAFQSRAASEYQSLRETHGDGAGRRGCPVTAASATKSCTTSFESLRRETEEMRAKLTQMALTLRTKQQGLPSRYSPKQSPLPGKAQLSFETTESQWRDFVLSVQQHRELLRTTIEELKTSTRSWSDGMERGRRQLTAQREEVRIVRRAWEGKIRSQLSSCLTVQNTDVPPLASLTTSTLESLSRRVEDLRQKQGALRSTRSAFAGQMAASVRSLRAYRTDTERLLGDVFSNFEVLRERSVQAELDELSLRSMQAQLEALYHHVSQEAHRLAAQKRSLDAVVKDMRAGHPVALPSIITLADNFSQDQSTQIFTGRTSPLFDITNASHHRLNCHPPQAHANITEMTEASAATRKEAVTKRHTHSSSATTPSLIALRHGGGERRSPTTMPFSNDSETRPPGASGVAAPTTVSASSGADVLVSESPSPIIPSLGGLSGWMQQQQQQQIGGGCAGGACISVSPKTEDVPNKAEGEVFLRSVDSDANSTMDLEPIENVEGDDESAIAPLRPYSSH
ncbi:l6202.3-like protein [Leptomonas pyrrhocoris]|uniref:L6202.3-like protein n=1 Tax=Leptomonas pyrrhocoris TaxID=157538 RepID=A0A0M9G440_LEPPY|nr:l6202.3-like protein [Leptomonas pyrrhocoris]KPA81749.1 l6202.3-like protein [Leptomonas pyrrhocoris]|eukprot:XP_015660188.1 l6202.3-like protein [Leptomonas pyrrhocoris]